MSWFTKLLNIEKLVIGDVWTMKEDNPFAKKTTVQILDLKDGYVLYKVILSEGKDCSELDVTLSKDKSGFRKIYEK